MEKIKKVLVSSLFLTFAITASAQLKVYSNGNVAIKRTLSDNPHSLNIGDGGIAESGYKIPLFSRVNTSSWGSYNIGIDGFSFPSISGDIGHGRAYGVRGMAGRATSGYNYGVFGCLYTNQHNGAGIFGSTTHVLGIDVSGQYAGFFDGPTYVNGVLTANSIVNLADLRSCRDVSLLNDNKGVSALENIMEMSVITYHSVERNWDETRDTVSTVTMENNKKTEDVMHYGLSVKELQKLYPELVIEGQDGYLCINYIELVPILVRSIQELKQQLDKQTNASTEQSLARSSNDFDDNETTHVDSPTNTPAVVAKLAQNTPNPFTERTTIRFSLPEDAQNAYIYIFDMTGKMQKQLPIDASMQSITINGYELSAGMYIYSLVVNGKEMDTKRMILSK